MKMGDIILYERNTLAGGRRVQLRKYTPKWQARKPNKAMESVERRLPRCTVVSGQIDLNTGCVVVECKAYRDQSDPDEKANPLK